MVVVALYPVVLSGSKLTTCLTGMEALVYNEVQRHSERLDFDRRGFMATVCQQDGLGGSGRRAMRFVGPGV